MWPPAIGALAAALEHHTDVAWPIVLQHLQHTQAALLAGGAGSCAPARCCHVGPDPPPGSARRPAPPPVPVQCLAALSGGRRPPTTCPSRSGLPGQAALAHRALMSRGWTGILQPCPFMIRACCRHTYGLRACACTSPLQPTAPSDSCRGCCWTALDTCGCRLTSAPLFALQAASTLPR